MTIKRQAYDSLIEFNALHQLNFQSYPIKNLCILCTKFIDNNSYLN